MAQLLLKNGAIRFSLIGVVLMIFPLVLRQVSLSMTVSSSLTAITAAATSSWVAFSEGTAAPVICKYGEQTRGNSSSSSIIDLAQCLQKGLEETQSIDGVVTVQTAEPNTTSSLFVLPEWMYHSDKMQVIHGSSKQEKRAVATTTKQRTMMERSSRLSDHVVLHMRECSSSSLPPMHRLLELIPVYAANVTLVYSNDGGGCSVSPQQLQQVFPWARIRIEKSSHFLLQQATLLICLDSSSLECTLSALLVRPSSEDSLHYSMIVGEVPYLKQQTDRFLLPAGVRIIASPADSDASTCHAAVRYHPSGSWSYNETFGNETFYDEHQIWMRDHYMGPSSQLYDSYVWQPSSSCGTKTMNRRDFCKAFRATNISRVLALGDSLKYMELLSLMHILGYGSLDIELRKHRFAKNKYRAVQIVECNDGKEPIRVIFHRVNHLMPLLAPKSFLDNGKDVFDYIPHRFGEEYKTKGREYFSCFGLEGPYLDDGICPWVNEYLSSNEPTMIWTGLGSHFHHIDAFQESMTSFMDLLDQHPRPNDVVWFRTQHPGHQACLTTNRKMEPPYESFQDYQKRGVTELYDWGLYRHHNQYMEELVWKNRFRQQHTTRTMGLQDIYWMTAMRRDGHVTSSDCLHYMLPGPPDWWNHMMLADLQDLAAAKQL